MQTDTIKKLFTVREYHQMAEAGILGPDERTELIDGEIIQMSPIGHKHVKCVMRATYLFTLALQGKAIVSAQNPLVLNDYSEPQPDVVLLKYRADFYKSQDQFSPEDTLLALEVSETSIRYDLSTKLPRYAAAKVPEVWIANLNADEFLVFRDPEAGAYVTHLTFRRADSVSPAVFPAVVFKVDDLLG